MSSPWTLVLLAAGSGERLGAGVPKALVSLRGETIVAQASRACLSCDPRPELVLVVPPGEHAEAVEASVRAVGWDPRVVPGGARRRDSVRAALSLVETPHLLVHDAARALADAALVRRVLEAARARGAAIPAIPVPDTLVRGEGDAVAGPLSREGVFAIQTPQGFERELLVRAHEQAPPEWDASDDGSMVHRLGHEVALVEGDPLNFKITWPADLERALATLRARDPRGRLE